jgi:4-amino-4-deoxy-L-arabinose transferase-like glycosyltransferase
VLWLVLGTTALRLLFAAGTGLGIDESYMVAAGRTLRLSYFDHPGMAWWLSRLAALLLGDEAPIAVRLPFVALFAVSTALMFLVTKRLFGDRAGFWACVALNLSPVFSVTTGTWVLPDGPLTCALLAALYALARALEPERPEADDRARPAVTARGSRGSWVWWGLAGLFAGLAMLSKYSAVLVLIGIVPYLVLTPRDRPWLRRPQPYVAALISLACCAPILIWNATHDWASFAFQGGRAATHAPHPWGPLVTLAGEALFVGPWLWPPLMALWLSALRHGPERPKRWLLAWLGATPLVLFTVVSLWARHVLFHWAAPGYLMLIPMLGAWAERIETTRPRLLAIGWRTGAAVIGVGVALLLIEARVDLLARFGVDPGLQAVDWTPLRDQLVARGLPGPGTVIAGLNWHDTGKLDYALGGSLPVLCFNSDARQYRFAAGAALRAGENVLLIAPPVEAGKLTAAAAGQFAAIEALPPLRLRGRPMLMVLARNWQGGMDRELAGR